MPTLQELKKRLKSAETIEQLSGAMRSAATAKYRRAGKAFEAYAPYAAALAEIGGKGSGEPYGDADGKTLFVLLSGNHGLCGGYHPELFTFFTEKAWGRDTVVCGKRAREWCANKGQAVLKSFSASDVPSFEEAKELASYVWELYSEGKFERVVIVYQRFINMLKRVPTAEVFLSGTRGEDGGGGETLFIPDRETVEAELEPLILASNMYEKLLSASAAAQAATVLAMRSAFDNAEESISELDTEINRLRQAAVTAGVLETSVEFKE